MRMMCVCVCVCVCLSVCVHVCLYADEGKVVLRALIAELDALSDALEEATLPPHHSAVRTLSPCPAFVGVKSQSLKHQSARPSHSSTQSRGSHAAFMANDTMILTLAGAESAEEESISSCGATLPAAWESEGSLVEKGGLLPVGVGESGGGEGERGDGHTQGEGGELAGKREEGWGTGMGSAGDRRRSPIDREDAEGASDHDVSTIVPIHVSHPPFSKKESTPFSNWI